MILFEKFGTHQPLNRQRDRYAREGVELSLSTLADQVRACAAALRPLHRLIEAHVLVAERLHGDDTTVPVLARTKTDVGRLWTYVRDDRPFAGPAPPATLFRYSCDRRAEHPVRHLADYRGILQAATPMPATTRCSGRIGCRCRSRARCAGHMRVASSLSWRTSPAS